MIKIDSVGWLKIKIAGKDFQQVLIANDQVLERDYGRLKTLFGTAHQIADWEEKTLFESKPEIIVIGSGWQGVLKVSPEFQAKCEKMGVKLQILTTPKAVAEYNRLIAEGKKVNALIHTTC